MRLSEININDLNIKKDGEFKKLAHCTTNTIKEVLTFCSDKKYIDYINRNLNIRCVVCSEEHIKLIKRKDLGIIQSTNPKYTFFSIHNILNENKFNTKKPIIGNNSKISKSAVIKNNVVIGTNVIIEENVLINENVKIGSNSIIRKGAVIGGQGFEFKRNGERNILTVKHYGKTILNENIEVKEYTTIHQALFDWDSTVIDDYTKIDSHTHIGHGCKIGKRCLIGSHCNFAGNVTVFNDVYVGLGSTISNRLYIERNSKISLGSVLTKNVKENTVVSGNFAILHDNFIKFIKKISKNIDEN